MKKALIVLGSAFLSLIVLAIGGLAASHWIVTAADRDGKAYVDRVTPTIVAAWDPSALVGQASPEFLSAAPRAKIDTIFNVFSNRLGTLQRYGGASRQDYFVNFTLHGPVVTLTYTADATFEKGPATLRIRTVRHGAEWKLLEFFVHSEALLR